MPAAHVAAGGGEEDQEEEGRAEPGHAGTMRAAADGAGPPAAPLSASCSVLAVPVRRERRQLALADELRRNHDDTATA